MGWTNTRRAGRIGSEGRRSAPRGMFPVLVGAAALAVLMSFGRAGAEPCLPTCTDTPAKLEKVQNACTKYADEKERIDGNQEKCVRPCCRKGMKPFLAGHCEWTRKCLATCRGIHASNSRELVRNLRRRMRKVCRTESPPQPGCSIGLGTARGACESFVSTAITNALPEICGDLDSEVAPQQTGGEDGGECGDACVEHTLRDCFGDCFDACEGDRDALNLCRTACRNRHCELIELVCGCVADVDCVANPVTTTTSSTSTTTSTTTTTLL